MDTIEVSKGQDFAVEYRIRAGDGHGKPIRVTITADANAGALSLAIKPDHPDLADNAVLLFGNDGLVVVNGACLAGDTSLAIDALAFDLDAGNTLELLVDLTGYTMKAVVLPNRGDVAADALIADTALAVTVPTQTGNNHGKCSFVGLAAATVSKTAGSYYGTFWRRDSGNVRPLAEFTFKLIEAGEDGFA